MQDQSTTQIEAHYAYTPALAFDEAAGIQSGCELMQGVYTKGTFIE